MSFLPGNLRELRRAHKGPVKLFRERYLENGCRCGTNSPSGGKNLSAANNSCGHTKNRLSPKRINWIVDKFEVELTRNTGRNFPLSAETQVSGCFSPTNWIQFQMMISHDIIKETFHWAFGTEKNLQRF